tara:strand:- start:797 stop:1018 length:222 start_codon:yes stop_codon:yes gene_type:complete
MGMMNPPRYSKTESELALEKQMEEERLKAEKEKAEAEAKEKKYKSRVDRGLVGSRSMFSRAGGRGFYTEGEEV